MLLIHTVFSATVDEGQVILTFLVLVGFNLLFALIAAALIAFEVNSTTLYFVRTYVNPGLQENVVLYIGLKLRLLYLGHRQCLILIVKYVQI